MISGLVIGFSALILIRVTYASLLLIGTLVFRFGFGNALGIEQNLGVMLMATPLWYFIVWSGFVVGYVVSALLVLIRSRVALPVYILAFSCDFLLTLYWFQQPGMDRVYHGSANLVEWVLNGTDLTIITVLLLTGGRLPLLRPKARA